MEKLNMFLNATMRIFDNANILRSRETPTEMALWAQLSNRQLGVKFRRQHPILTYIVDFYCHQHRLAIEVDGGIHLTEEQASYDEMRTQDLQSHQITVIRFTNDEVLIDIGNVLKRIKLHLSQGTT